MRPITSVSDAFYGQFTCGRQSQIRDASDIATLRQTCQEAFDVLVDSGVLKGPSQLQMSDQAEVVRVLCLHQLVLKSKAKIDQISFKSRVPSLRRINPKDVWCNKAGLW